MALVGWKYYREIQINNTDGNADLIDYQICVELNYNNFDFTKPKSDGSDIRFTNSDKTTLLSYWIENYDAEHEKATIWVKVPLIPKNSTKSIFIWYGNKNATSESDGSVMTSGFVSNVDPFGDGSGVALWQFDGNANDTGGNYNGTWHGTEQYDTGKFGQAAKFDGNSYITGFHILRPDKCNQTVSFWSLVTDDYINSNSWVIFSTTNNNAYDITIHPHGILSHGSFNSQHHLTTNVDTNFINKNEFYHTVLIFDKDNTTIKLYINGVLQVVNSDWTGQCYSGSTNLTRMGYGGDRNKTTYYFNGLIDQVRIFNRALTAEEVAILYHNDIYAIGSESIIGSKISGVVCDKNGNPITGATVKVFVFDKDSGELYGKTTSNSTDGTWSNNQITAPPNTKVLTVFTLEGDYNGDTDIAGAEFDITQEGS